MERMEERMEAVDSALWQFLCVWNGLWRIDFGGPRERRSDMLTAYKLDCPEEPEKHPGKCGGSRQSYECCRISNLHGSIPLRH